MSLSMMPVKEEREITDLLANWSDTPASGHCFHCYRFAAGASKGVPCYDCRDDVQHEADIQAWRDEEAASEAWGREAWQYGDIRLGYGAWEERD